MSSNVLKSIQILIQFLTVVNVGVRHEICYYFQSSVKNVENNNKKRLL